MTPEPIKGSHANAIYLNGLTALNGIELTYVPNYVPPVSLVLPGIMYTGSVNWLAVDLSQFTYPGAELAKEEFRVWATFVGVIEVPDDLRALLTEHFGNTEPRL